jgi:hypothetical protein
VGTPSSSIADLGLAAVRRKPLTSLAAGRGGGTRQINPAHERARAAVTWRIRAAIRKIAAAHGSLGRHLDNAVKTRSRCVYAPEKPLAREL